MEMASSMFYLISATIALLFCIPGALGGNVVCEELSRGSCAYAVSSSGKRCVLEKRVENRKSREEAFICRSSEIEAADQFKGWIETEECVRSCALDRNSLGISSDSLLDSHFTRKLCSTPCYHACPNVVDLYFSLAVGEGVYLPKLCESQEGGHARREMAEVRSSGLVAEGPESGNGVGTALAGSISPAYPPFPF